MMVVEILFHKSSTQPQNGSPAYVYLFLWTIRLESCPGWRVTQPPKINQSSNFGLLSMPCNPYSNQDAERQPSAIPTALPAGVNGLRGRDPPGPCEPLPRVMHPNANRFT